MFEGKYLTKTRAEISAINVQVPLFILSLMKHAEGRIRRSQPGFDQFSNPAVKIVTTIPAELLDQALGVTNHAEFVIKEVLEIHFSENLPRLRICVAQSKQGGVYCTR